MPMIRQAMTSRFRQCGVAAVVFLAIFAVIMLGVLTTALGSRSVQNEYDAKTFPVLAAAKDALIAYAAGHPNVPGRLPCADIDNDGVEDCALAGDQLGRLPWKTLGFHRCATRAASVSGTPCPALSERVRCSRRSTATRMVSSTS